MSSSPVSLTVTTVSPVELTSADLAQWAVLFKEQPAPANPFLAPPWVLAWYETFVETGDSSIVVIRDAQTNLLVGLAPMYVQTIRIGPLKLARRLLPVGAGIGPNPYEIPGMLAAHGSQREVIRALVASMMAGETEWCELALTPEQGWFEPEWSYNDLPVSFYDYQRPRACVVLPLATSWDETRRMLKRNVKESLRRSRNRLVKDGRPFRVRHLTRAELDESAVVRFLDLHQMRSRNSQATVHHIDAYRDKGNRELMLSVIPRLAELELASIFELELDGRVVAAQLALHAEGCSYVHSSGFDPSVWSLGPVTFLQAELVQFAIARGDSVVNFSPGPNVSKLRWSEQLWVTNEFSFGAGSKSVGIRYGAYQTISALRASTAAIMFSKRSSKGKVGLSTTPTAPVQSTEGISLDEPSKPGVLHAVPPRMAPRPATVELTQGICMLDSENLYDNSAGKLMRSQAKVL